MAEETIAILSGKGGVGKTSISANLGSILSHVFDKEVVIIDTDVTTSHLGVHMGFHYNPATITSVLQGEHDPEESVYEHETGVKVVPGALNYDEVKEVDVYNIGEIIDTVAEGADYAILDCSPGLDREASAALRASDQALYIARPSFTSVIDVVRTDSLLEDLETPAMGVVLNMVRGKKHEIGHDEVESFTGIDVIGSIPYDDAMEESAAQGTPLAIYEPDSPASRAIEDLAVEIIGGESEKKRSGLVRKIRELFPRL
ncbi:MAG: cell division ATPase MinD [Candidatus Nanohaloarchaeota archaeon QJJ-7]|nr:cell division ATPase MinD [Candidatus Nanohaloarchaeota archaeon QJJ-7]